MGKKYDRLTFAVALQLSMPPSWVASLVPALFGIFYSALRTTALPVWKSIAVLLACVFMQSAVNTWNDYFDFIKGTDRMEDPLEKKDAILLYYSLPLRKVFLLGLFYLVIGLFLGAIASIGAGWIPFGIACIGMFVVALYSGGPLPISYLPLGEIVSGFVMGSLIPLAITAISDGRFHPEVLYCSFPIVLGIILIMMSNNTCDIEKDKQAKRKTLSVLLGRKKARIVYQICILIWILSYCIFSFLHTGYFVIVTGAILLLGKETFFWLWKSVLEPKIRIQQMKTIIKANVIGSIAYLLPLSFRIIFGSV